MVERGTHNSSVFGSSPNPASNVPKMNDAMARFMATIPLAGTLETESVEQDLCGHKAFNEIDGEDYICCLPAHSSKVKHGAWLKA